MIDGPTLFDTLMAGSTMLFAGTTIWFSNQRASALKLADDMDIERRAALSHLDKANAGWGAAEGRFFAADTARQTAIATHEAYLAAEPERQAAHLKAYFSRIAVKGNQSPKRKRG